MKTNKREPYIWLFIFFLAVTSTVANANWWENLFNKKPNNPTELSESDMSAAFKQALSIGATNVVAQLGSEGGFYADEAIRIPLPENLKKVADIVKKVGLSGQIDSLELQINQAAETAVPVAKEIFIMSIESMTFEDVKSIYQGSDDSATQYFKDKMTASLSEKMRPIINQSLSEVGAIRTLNKVMNSYQELPFVSAISPDMSDYVVGKTIDAVFYYLAEQERSIRKNPMQHGSELLKKVFGR